jgi:hypothetical protein
MIKQNREKKAISLASEILEAAGLLSAPVDLFALAAQESPRLAVKSGDFRDCFDGRLEYHAAHDRFILFFNTKYDRIPGEHHPRTRFSIAHELGHFYLDEHRAFLMQGGQTHSSTSEFAVDDIVEREADAFGAGLLMPEKLIRPLVNQGEPTAERIKNIAEHFRTSLLSAAIRSVFVSDFPCEIVGVRNGLVAWCFSSDALIEGRCYPLPKGPLQSPTARKQWQAFQSGNSLEEESCTSPFHWFNSYGPAENAFMVSEYYLPVPTMNTLLILVTVPEEDLFNLHDQGPLKQDQ